MNTFLSSWTNWSVCGRASRSEYWMFILLNFLLSLLFLGVYGVLMYWGFHYNSKLILHLAIVEFVVFAALFVIGIIPSFCVLVRRLHDAGLSGWLVLLNLLPVGPLLMLVFTVLPSHDSSGRLDSHGNSRQGQSATIRWN